MQTIEINTTQNVIIKYEIAYLRDRILAFAIDFLILVGAALVILFFAALFITSKEMMMVAVYILMVPIFFFYSLVSEVVYNGQSIGKKAMHLKIMKIDGKEPQIGDYMLRWIFRMLDIYASLGMLATLLVSSSGKGQRLGDIVAETTVIKVKPSRVMTLSDILMIGELKDYEASYPEVRKLSEQEMVIVKTVLNRYIKHPNAAHEEVILSLVKRLKEKLDIQPLEGNIQFLKTLLNDYVYLTR